MTTGCTADTQCDFGYRLARIARRWRQEIDEEIKAFGVTDATWRPLLYLNRIGDGVRQKDLAAILGIEGPSLVRLLDNLERAGLIERREDDVDRRAKVLCLTAPGRAISDRVRKIGVAVQSRLLAGIDEADLVVCQRVFERIERALDDASTEAMR